MKKSKTKGFQKILIANRGEIACRITSACHALGIYAVSVFSDADKNARHVRLADESIHLGGGPPKESYLDIAKVISAAKKCGADAIHPGYGFLSERAEFADAVTQAGLCFIGPRAQTIELMGNKIAAKKAAEKVRVSTLPWALLKDGWGISDLHNAAKKVGFPLVLKAAAGGGGRGMRLVEKKESLETLARSAAAEAQGAFGSGELFLESYCSRGRHIEVQVLGDQYGNIVTLGDRDCSSQRRHQKVIEEALGANLSEKTRQGLWDSALKLAKSVGYENGGTCEFLVDENGKFYFLEMNTRLQVEHPVTEAIYGIDLVSLQIQIARGEKLPASLKSIVSRGHAIEARVYAEDPARDFMPSPGRLQLASFPHLSGVRVETGYETGDEIPLFYDAMIAKLVVWGEDREQARRKLIEALNKTLIEGIRWNGGFLCQLLESKEFKEARIDTQFIAREFLKKWVPSPPSAMAMPDPARAQSPWIAFANTDATPVFKSKNTNELQQENSIDPAHDSRLAGPLVAEYPGKVLNVLVKVGQKVKEGDVVLVCESMKMEFSYPAPFATQIKAVHVKPGQVVAVGNLLVEWESAT